MMRYKASYILLAIYSTVHTCLTHTMQSLTEESEFTVAISSLQGNKTGNITQDQFTLVVNTILSS